MITNYYMYNYIISMYNYFHINHTNHCTTKNVALTYQSGSWLPRRPRRHGSPPGRGSSYILGL